MRNPFSRQPDPRIQELLDLAEAEGITLPYDPETIISQEDLGNVVDLETGAIILSEADTAYDWSLTPKGERLARILKGEV